MRESNVYIDKEARDKLMKGVSVVAGAVKGTLGAAGYNAMLEKDMLPYHMITNDGVSIAKDIVMTDPVENMGANLAKEIGTRSDKESGDGTTTSITLLEAILKAGEEVDAQPMELKRSLDACLPIINKALDDQKKEITIADIAQVATVSAESEELGKLFQEVYEHVGKDGIIEFDNSVTAETDYVLGEGVRLRNCRYMAPYMANDGNRAVYKRPKILITKQKISTLADIDPICQKLNAEGINELVIFCDDIDASVLGALAFTHVKGIFKSLVIKAPALWKDWLFEDFAKITGATIIGPESGLTWKTVDFAHLGTCDKLVTDKEETRVVGTKDISEHIKQLEEDGQKNDQLLLRASWLNTKVATIRLGANSESELSYLRLKAEDARGACYLALKDGIVPGGGVALANASDSLPATSGGTVLKAALCAPIFQIVKNAGADINILLNTEDADNQIGFDARTGKLVNMFEAGIVDPTLVVKNAIKNAISVAGTVLTSRVIITIPRKDDQEPEHQGASLIRN